MDFQETLAFGRIGEQIIEQWLIRARGYSVLPIYDIAARNNKGPRMQTPEGDYIAPDILAIKGRSDVRWIETKHKKHYSWYRIGQQWVTGIDLYQYAHYQQITNFVDWPVWLLFLHSESDSPEGICPVGLYGNRLDKLVNCESHRSDNWGKSGMVYWGVSDLQKLAELHELLALNID